MMKKIIIILLACSCFSMAADVASILFNQKKAAFPDTAEIRMRTTVTMQGMPAQTMESRLISKGVEKNITEIKSSLLNMKIVRNGDKISVTDLKTGAVMPSQMAENSATPDINQNLGSVEDYQKPVKEGGLWKMSPVNPEKATMFYSEELKRIVKMKQTIQQGIENEINIKYCDNKCAIPGIPKSIEIETSINGQSSSKVLLEIISVQKLNSIPDALFNIPRK